MQHKDSAQRRRRATSPSWEPQECGRIVRCAVDDAAAVAWVETDSHGMTLDVAGYDENRHGLTPGEPVCYRADLGLAGVGDRDCRRWFAIAHEVSTLVRLDETPDRGRLSSWILLVLSLAMAGVSVTQFLGFTGWVAIARQQAHDAYQLLPLATSTIVAQGVVLLWRRAIRGWTFRPVLGMATKMGQ